MRKKKLLAIGECMIEMSQTPDGGWRMGYAGDTVNFLWYARASLPREIWRTEFCSCVGTDRYSGQMLAFLEQNGIETGAIVRLPDRQPGLYLIHQEAGDRHFTYWRENSAARMLAASPERLSAALADVDVIAFSGITLAILSETDRGRLVAALSAKRSAGARIVFDPNLRPKLWSDAAAMCAATMQAARISDVVLPTFDDDSAAFGDSSPFETLTRYKNAGCGEIVIKNGPGDALVFLDGETETVPALKVKTIVDTTGAGNSFNGAYIASRLCGSAPAHAAREGHRIAARVICHMGALMPVQHPK